jgi:hypothetical protein
MLYMRLNAMTTRRRTTGRLVRLVALLISCAALAASAFAQSNKGTIVGTIKDPNGAVVSGARVTVTNIATGETKEVMTDDEGTYTAPALDPGRYRVSVDATGFQSAVVEEVVVETNARQPVDVALGAGGVSGGTVTVTAEAPLVESETSVRGDVITGRQVVDLPIPQRNFTLLAGLSPGVTRPVAGVVGGGGQFSGADQPTGASTESTRFRESGGSVISANGARVTNNNFTLDGVDNNESQFGQIGIFPSPDAIAEFKVETSVPSAESGRAGGAIISTTFKSGTNEVHGTLFEFYQGRFGSARPTNNTNPPNYVTHNFGGTIGGPIFLPRPGEGGPMFYDGRNRSFFFFSYNGQRNGTPAFGGGEFPFVTVPTARMRNGDFSELLEPGTLVTYRTPSGNRLLPRGTIFDAAGNPFPGNIIPQALLNPVAQAYLNAYPLPTESGLTNNFRRNRAERSNVDGWDVKIDHTGGVFGASTAFFGRYSQQKNRRLRDNNFPLGTSPNGNDLASGFGAGDEFGDSRQVALGATTSFTPTVINDARAGYTRVNIGIFNPGVGGALGFSATNAADLGTQQTNTCGVVCSGTVLLGITGTGPNLADTEFVGDGGPFFFTSNNFYFGDTLTVVRGNQTLKFGGDLRVRQNVNLDAGRSGSSKGNIVYTTGADVTLANGNVENLNRNGFFSGRRDVLGGVVGPQDAGAGLANFLLGYAPTEVSRGIPAGIPFLSSKEISFFVQDDWKVNPNLTLNLGLRYDVFTPQTERFDRQANFNPATGQLVRTTEESQFGRGGIETDKNNFGPRIGFAYSGFREDKKLVLRGGYGLLYATDVSGQQPLSSNFIAGGRYDRLVLAPGVNIQTGAPVPSTNEPAGASFAPSAGATVFFNDPNARTEMFHQFNLTGQYEFAPNWLAEIGYVSSRGRNLLVVRNLGQGTNGARVVAGIDQVIFTENVGSSWYDSMQTKLEKRFSNGLSILSSYTWAHAIDNTPGGFCIPGPDVSGCGPSNPVLGLDLDKGNSDLDVRHRFTFANVLDLPFGRNRRFASDMPLGLDYIVGGWQLNNVVTIQSGPVFSVFANGARVDLIGDPFANLANGRQLNRAAFRAAQTPIFASSPTGPRFGNLGRNTFRGERQEFWDASLFKNIPMRWISEDFAAQIRIQAYNVLNHINHYRPINNLNDVDRFGLDVFNQRARQLEFSLKLLF